MNIAGKFKRFYARQNTSALLGFFAGSEYPLYRYPRTAQSLPRGRELAPQDFDINAFVADSEALFELHKQCGGDFIYSGSAFWGIPWIEAICGLPLFVGEAGAIEVGKPDDDMNVACFFEENGWVRLAGDMLDALADSSGRRYPLASTRTRGVSDMLQAVIGAEDMIFAMMDEPERIKKLAHDFATVIMSFWEFEQRHIPQWQGGQGSFYYHMWTPRNTFWHQEDAASILSPALFEEFIQPENKRMLECGNVILHQHPSDSLPLRQNISTGYLAIELHVDTGGVPVDALAKEHELILTQMPLLIWGSIGLADLHYVRSLPQQGLALQIKVDNPRQAQEFIKEWENIEK